MRCTLLVTSYRCSAFQTKPHRQYSIVQQQLQQELLWRNNFPKSPLLHSLYLSKVVGGTRGSISCSAHASKSCFVRLFVIMIDLVVMSVDVVPSQDWEPDSSSSSCRRCKLPWTLLTRRRHHCRCCGKLVCDACSKSRVKFQNQTGYVRACAPCCTMFLAQAQENRHLRANDESNGSAVPSTATSRANTEEWPTTRLLTEESDRCDTDEEDFNDPLHELRGPSLDEDDGDDFALFALDANPKRHSTGPLILEAFGSPEHVNKRRSGVPPLLTVSELNETPVPLNEQDEQYIESAATPEFLRMSFGDSEKF